MTCPCCEKKTKVMETTQYEDAIYRKRTCLSCGYQFVTKEQKTTDEKMFDAFYQRGIRYRKKKPQ